MVIIILDNELVQDIRPLLRIVEPLEAPSELEDLAGYCPLPLLSQMLIYYTLESQGRKLWLAYFGLLLLF